MNEINKRFIDAIKALGLTQKRVANEIGVTPQAITLIKSGVNVPSNSTLKSFCARYNVNYPWLKDGVGEMFSDYEDKVLEHLQEQYDMTASERIIVQTFLQSDEETRKAITRFLLKLSENVKKGQRLILQPFLLVEIDTLNDFKDKF